MVDASTEDPDEGRQSDENTPRADKGQTLFCGNDNSIHDYESNNNYTVVDAMA